MSTGLPRLPLDGSLDLTYRCNNSCRHCWLRLPADAPEIADELSFAEIRRIVDEARAMGCQAWAISGGEPMLRPDFADIFDYITRKSVHYSLNTNGTLISPEVARLLTRPGDKMVALYGATAEVHDHVTCTPGSFDAAMRGCALLKEAGAGFTIQIIPMRDNYHQYDQMVELARSLGSDCRVGAAWLYFSACRSTVRNEEIARQRLDPADVVALDGPDPGVDLLEGLRPGKAVDGGEMAADVSPCGTVGADGRLFASCAGSRREFHIDAYGRMAHCCFIKDPELRYDLRRGTFREAWDDFLPSLADRVHVHQEYFDNCGSCDLRSDCHWCGVYGYLEHGRYSAKVEYLCRVAEETRRFKEEWKLTHLRYYQIAGVTIQLTADFPFSDTTFHPKFEKFRVKDSGSDVVSIRLVSSIPSMSELRLGEEVLRKPPWAIYRTARAWVYLGITSDKETEDPYIVAIFDADYSRGTICRRAEFFEEGHLGALSTFGTDQILLGRVLAERQGCYLHASGIIIDGEGLVFVGHSEAGKSTMLKMLGDRGEILCDDRIVIRRWPDGFRVHGTWSHGELPDVSPAGAPLRAMMFLEKADDNELVPVTNPREVVGEVLSHVVKPMITADWWEKILGLAGDIAAEVPAYRLRFDKSGAVADLLKALPASQARTVSGSRTKGSPDRGGE